MLLVQHIWLLNRRAAMIVLITNIFQMKMTKEKEKIAVCDVQIAVIPMKKLCGMRATLYIVQNVHIVP